MLVMIIQFKPVEVHFAKRKVHFTGESVNGTCGGRNQIDEREMTRRRQQKTQAENGKEKEEKGKTWKTKGGSNCYHSGPHRRTATVHASKAMYSPRRDTRRKKRRKQHAGTGTGCDVNTTTIEIRNIRGIRTSLEAIHATVERREEDGRTPIDVFIFLESFSTMQAPLELEGYERLQGVSATRAKEAGRRSGGIEVFVRNACAVPIQTLRTGKEPNNCVTVIVGGGPASGSLAIIAYYLAPTTEAICDTFFTALGVHTSHLQRAGYGTVAGGDANAHIGLDIGRTEYRDNPDYAGVSWLAWAEQTNQDRLTPDSPIQWTYYSMRASDFADAPDLPREKGRSIADHLSADEKARPLVEKYELNLRDHYRTDHAGLLFPGKSRPSHTHPGTEEPPQQKGPPQRRRPGGDELHNACRKKSPRMEHYHPAGAASLARPGLHSETHRSL